MAVLRLQVPHRQRSPQILIENQLAEGRHIIRLVVRDDEGNVSDPVDAVINVIDRSIPGPFRPGGT
jgi:hypothetical protein